MTTIIKETPQGIMHNLISRLYQKRIFLMGKYTAKVETGKTHTTTYLITNKKP